MIKVIAHRGASLEAPENTIAAFKRAHMLGAKWIELDVWVTSDHIPIVIHDESVVREDHSYLVTKQPLSFLRKLGQEIPTLEEVMALFENKIDVMVEIKYSGDDYQKDVDAIMKVLHKRKGYIVGSLSPKVVTYIAEKYPDSSLVGIVESEKDYDQFALMEVEVLALNHQLVTREKIHALHQKEIEVWSWTIDDCEHVQELFNMGLDGVITNNVAGMLRHFPQA